MVREVPDSDTEVAVGNVVEVVVVVGAAAVVATGSNQLADFALGYQFVALHCRQALEHVMAFHLVASAMEALQVVALASQGLPAYHP